MPYENGVWRPHSWADWEIELVDGSLNTIGVLDEAVGLALEWALYGYGTASCALHIQSDRATDLLGAGMFYFRVYRDGVQLRDYMLAKDDRGYTVSNQRVDEYIQISLSPLDMLLKDRPCLPSAPFTNFATPELPLDDGFKWIVDHVVGPDAYDGPGGSSCVVAGLTIAANESAHGTTAVISEAHRMDLFEFLQKYGPTWEIDWRVRLEKTTGQANQFVFETFTPARGLDKTEDNYATRQPVIINDASGEIPAGRRYRPAVGFANVIIGKKLTTEVKDTASVAIYGRHAIIADTDDPEKLAALLSSRAQRVGYEFDFSESESLSVGTGAAQVQPGDTVTLANNYLGVTAHDELVKQIAFSIEDGGHEQAKLIFGEYEKTLPDKIKEASGGSGGSSGVQSAGMGLKDTLETFVPFVEDDDGNESVWLYDTDGYIEILGNVTDSQLAFTLKQHPLIGLHVPDETLTPNQVLTATAEDAFGWAAITTEMLASPDAAGFLHSDGGGTLAWTAITEGLLELDISETYLQPITAGLGLRVRAAAVGEDPPAEVFRIEPDGDVIGSGGSEGGPYATCDLHTYDGQFHDETISGDVFSIGSGSGLYWTQDGDIIHGRYLKLYPNDTPDSETFTVDGATGNSVWGAGATLTFNGDAYTPPAAYPGASGYALVSTDAGVLSWSDISGSIITDHGGLGGLTDDDHTQYLNTTRHAALASVATTHVGRAVVSDTAPEDPYTGMIWLDMDEDAEPVAEPQDLWYFVRMYW